MKTLKTLAVVVIAALTFSLTSCTKSAEDLIIGTWESTNFTMTSVASGYTGEYAVLNGTRTETENGNTTLTFKDNGTVVSTTVEDSHTETETGTYKVEDDDLILTYDGVTMTMDIDNIDKKSMLLVAEDSYDDTDDGQNAHIEITVKMSFKRK